ncbi:UvrD-helicase domain-containing protein [Ferrimicrobium sp.]|uniref:UvrD-helicase domain-containing protein n=1 Tax=Ferrimicrobium sp. TaxID=2926050 RepID=UPI002623B273|nr:UvrD-helicase domain-containing protein [Ferrimicrobium sp.]
MELSDRQRQAVTSSGDVAISAGAGTGKTQTMAARYLAHVEAGLHPLSIVAVTFTVRAAAELRHRILIQMRERYRANDPRVLEVEVAPIGTIDSLCQHICTEFPIESELDFDFEVVDETSYRQLLSLEMPRLLEQVPPASYELLDYATLKSFVTDCLKDLERFRSAAAVDVAAIKAAIQAARLDAIQTGPWLELETALQRHQALRSTDLIEQNRLAALRGLRLLRQGDNEGWEVLSTLNRRGGSARNWLTGEYDLVKEDLRILQEQIKELPDYVRIGWSDTDEQHQAALSAVRDAVEIVATQLQDLKRAQGIVDFADLETHALTALKNEMVSAELADRWRAILVDEVQDISPLQYQLLARLGRNATLSAVGDPKQSLYRFRGADPELFAQQIARSQEHVTLDENYRTVPELVELVNNTFTKLIPDYQALRPIRTTRYPRPPIEIMVVDETSDATMAARRRLLSERIGNRILDLLEEPFEIVDPLNSTLRQVKPQDIAIISASWDMLDRVAEELQRLQLPANIVGGGRLLASQESLDALTILSFCANPHEDLSCIALMRSPMVGLSDVELAQLGEVKDQSSSWFDFLRRQLGEDPRLEPLTRLPFSPTSLSPSGQLAMAGDILLYPEILGGLNHPERRRADWIALLDLVDERASRGFDTNDIISYLRFAISDGARIARPPVEAEDSISLVTVHASKGLEWPITIVIDLDRSPRPTPPFVIDPRRGIAFKLQDERSGHLSWITELQREEELLEERRRWYVATTRARDHLIVALASRDRVGALLDQLSEYHGITQLSTTLAPPVPRVVAGTEKPRYRSPQVDLSAPSRNIRHAIVSRHLTDFRHCPLLLATAEAPMGSVGRLRRLLLERAAQGLPLLVSDLDWLPALRAERLMQSIGQYQELLSSHLRAAPTLRHGTATISSWSIDWGPFLSDGDSIVDLTLSGGDLVGLSLAHAEQPGLRAGIFYLTQSRIHWFSPSELRSIERDVPTLLHELSGCPCGPRQDRASSCRHCRQARTCHWVCREDHRL